MGKSWLVCVCLGTLAWGQAQPAAPPAVAPAPAAEVPLSASVLTIKGVACPEFAKAATPTAAAGKTAAAKKPADCEITRAEFDKLTKALQQGPNPLNPQQKRTLAQQLPSVIALSEAAKKKGLDKTESYAETLKYVKLRILAQKMQESIRDQADEVPPAEVTAYYKENPEAFEQFSLDRLFIPKNKQPSAEDKDQAKEPEKMTEEQQKAKEAADKAKQEKGEQELTALADTLRQRAVAGEDFAKLQKEAFEAAGTKVENPTVNLPKVRRTGLPPAHAAVFELKVGEVSAVINDNGGHYIYKVVSKEVLPLDQVKDEIHNKLKGERLKGMMEKYSNSLQTVTNDAYFGAAPPAGPPHRPHPTSQMPPAQPQGGASPSPAPPAASAPAQSPTPATAPTKPN